MEMVDWKAVEHDVPKRAERRVLARVTVASANGATVGGQRIPRGTSHVLVYASEVPEILKRVATAEQLAMLDVATKSWEHKREKAVAPLRRKGDAKAIADFLARYPESPESEYHTMRGLGDRGVPSIREFTVIDPDVPPPDMPETRVEAGQAQIASLVQALASLPDAIAKGVAQAAQAQRGNGGGGR